MTKKVKTDLLLKNFASEYVQIILDKEAKTSRTTETHVETQEIPLIIQGYLTDIDDEFIYLGLSLNCVHQAIQRRYVIHIEITEESNMMEDLILSGEIPESGDSWN